MNKGVPRLHHDSGRSRHEPAPLIGRQQSYDKEDTGQDKAINSDEVPGARDPYSVGVTWSRDQTRDVAPVPLGRPDAIQRHAQRRKANPFRARCAVIIEIEPRMFHQDGKAAAHQHEEEEKIREMAPANPERKAVRPARGAFLRGSRGQNMGQTQGSILGPGQGEGAEREGEQPKQEARPDPDSKTPVLE